MSGDSGDRSLLPPHPTASANRKILMVTTLSLTLEERVKVPGSLRSVDAFPVIHRVDFLLEFLRGRLALHFHGGRQFPRLLGEIALQNMEPLDALVRAPRG